MDELYYQMLSKSINELIDTDKELKKLFERTVIEKMKKEGVVNDPGKWIYFNKCAILKDEIISEIPKLIKSFFYKKQNNKPLQKFIVFVDYWKINPMSLELNYEVGDVFTHQDAQLLIEKFEVIKIQKNEFNNLEFIYVQQYND